MAQKKKNKKNKKLVERKFDNDKKFYKSYRFQKKILKVYMMYNYGKNISRVILLFS